MVSEWDVLWQLGLALLLTSAIGLERELRQKSAGLRTYSREVVGACTRNGFAIADLAVDRPEPQADGSRLVRVALEVHGTRPVAPLASGAPGVHEVHAGDANELFD